jgi:two-component system, sensor histidine kinase LadS
LSFNKLSFFVALIVFATVARAQTFTITETTGKADALYLSSCATIASANDKTYTLQDIISKKAGLNFEPLNKIAPQISFTTGNYWVKVALKNNTQTKEGFFLETARPITDVVDLYIVSSTGQVTEQHSGDILPFDMRALQHRKTIFPITLNGGEDQTLYIHYKSDGEMLTFPLTLYTPSGIIIETAQNHLFFGLFFGVLLLAAVTYLFFYVGLLDRSFLYYGCYVISIGLLQFSLDGLFFQHIMPGGGWFYQRSLILFGVFTTFFLTKYVASFLALKQRVKTLNLLFNIVYVIIAIAFIMPLTGSKGLQYSYPFANAVGLVSLLLIIASVIYLLIKKQKVDVFFTIGIGFLVLGFVIFILNNFGVVPDTFITQNSSKIGTGLEIIFLSLSMSNRIRKLRSEKEEMQAVALKRSEEMNEMKTYFMSNMSHELRTPLNAIMGIADVMTKEVKDEDIKTKFEVIKYASVSLLSSVNDILDYSKIENGELTLDKEDFDPAKVLEQIKNNYTLQAEDKGLVFKYEANPNLPQKISGDAMRLSQIVNNILSNATKFTHQGVISFKVSYIKQENNGMQLLLSFTDTGMGIPKEKLDTVFNSFAQESIDNKRKFGGLGLGLSIVKKLVDLHGGTIELNSEVGKGTTCTIGLPYTIIEEKTETKPPTPKDTFDLGGAKILVVEDNNVNQFIMNAILSRWKNTGFSIAGNGEEALEALQREHYDIVLMDLQMPVMDGYEATECIRRGEAGESYINIPIIAVTADTTESTKIKVRQIGINEYMAKPIDQTALFEKIIELVV